MESKGAGGKSYIEGESWKTGSSLRKQRQAAYLEWLCTPEQLREPSTKRDFAEMMGVHESTLWRYEQRQDFQKEYMRRRRGLFKVTDAQSVLKAQIQIASDPDHKSSTQAARFLFDWMEKNNDTGSAQLDLSELDEDELLELLNEYLANKTESN